MNKKNVLVVDDEAINHFLCQKIMDSLHWINTTYSAFNGIEALAILEDHCRGIKLFPDLILLDLHMPLMNGVEFLKEYWKLECLNGKQHEAIIVIVSSSQDPDERNQIESLGINDFIPKPISLERVNLLVNKF